VLKKKPQKPPCKQTNKLAMFLKILTYLVHAVYNIAGANGGNYPVPPPET
jgi:hypothetical protein